MPKDEITREEIDAAFDKLAGDAESSGYHLNPDGEFTRELIWGLLTNEKRYGYRACPCRVAAGVEDEDLDIVCPCDYRDRDLDEYDACYCALYVSGSILRGEKEPESIPDRRPPPHERNVPPFPTQHTPRSGTGNLAYPVWRCRVCGYLCAREEAPDVCPICKAGKERFERFM